MKYLGRSAWRQVLSRFPSDAGWILTLKYFVCQTFRLSKPWCSDITPFCSLFPQHTTWILFPVWCSITVFHFSHSPIIFDSLWELCCPKYWFLECFVSIDNVSYVRPQIRLFFLEIKYRFRFLQIRLIFIQTGMFLTHMGHTGSGSWEVK